MQVQSVVVHAAMCAVDVLGALQLPHLMCLGIVQVHLLLLNTVELILVVGSRYEVPELPMVYCGGSICKKRCSSAAGDRGTALMCPCKHMLQQQHMDTP